MFNKHIKKISTINLKRFPYNRAGGKALQFIHEHGCYAGAIVVCWTPKKVYVHD